MKKKYFKTTPQLCFLISCFLFNLNTTAQNPVFVAQPDNPFGLVNIGSYSNPTFIDIDNDGDLDCFAGEQSGNFKFFENTGTATVPVFTTAVTNPFGLADIGILSAPTFIDIDNDGDLDCFAGESGGNFKYFENIGTVTAPNFTTVVTNPFGLADIGVRSAPTFIDIDNDGDLDCFAGENTGNFKYFENTGTTATPVFTAVVTNPFGLVDIGDYSTPTFVDIDNDGDLDCFAGESTGNFKYFEQITIPTVTTIVASNITSTTTKVAGNINTDGGSAVTERGIVYAATIDNANPEIGGTGITKCINGIAGTGSFTKLVTGLTANINYSYKAYAINGVGTSYGDVQTFTTLPTGVHTPVFLAQPDNPFDLTDIGLFSAPTFIDIDNDGDLDCFAGERYGNFKYFENAGTATTPLFTTVVSNPFGLTDIGFNSKPTFIDIDSDGDLDCITGEFDGNFKYFENTGTAATPLFAAVIINPFGLTNIGNYSTTSFIDIDNDGDLDCFSGENLGDFKYFENIGTATVPTFAAAITNPFGLVNVGSSNTPTFIDIDNDGDLDCIAGGSGGSFKYFKNTGTPTSPVFTTAITNPFGLADIGTSSTPIFIDIDNDGDVDCFSGEQYGNFKFFKQSKIWSGGTDTNWTTATNWSLGFLPTTTEDVVITNVANTPIINSGTHVTVNNITINASGVLTINGGGDLTINGNNTNNGTFTLESASSLIVNGTSSGNITYKRTLGSTNWYLVSNPFNGQNINTFTVTDVAINAIATNGVNYGVAPYDNNGTVWNYYTTSAGANNIASVGNFVTGKGYSMKRTATGDLNFTGTMPTTDVNISITDGTSNKFNLIGNPYPSYLPANANADAINNILTINTTQLQEETLWFWDQSTSSYTQINHASASRFIAPAQGFFVNAKISGGTFTFTEAMQSHPATDVFSRTTNNRFEINLAITDGTTTKNTEIYYINGTTTAFDNGYDSSIFSGTNNAFAVYTQTVTDSQGRKLGIQSLPANNYENMIIPIGVNAISGTEITFSVDAQNIPAGIDIYLENRTDNTFTKLNDNGSYTITLSADTNGVGQFYLRTSSSALGLEDVTLTGVSMYTTDNTTLKIIGLQNGKSTVKMFTLLGEKVLQQAFESTGNNNISLPKLAAGVYIVNVQNTHGTLTKKIILQ